MQLFVLDPDPEVCAQYHNDKHVRAMCVSYARALESHDPNDPLSDWAWQSLDNYDWLHSLLWWLNMEYRWRFRHGGHAVAENCLCLERPELPDQGFTVPPNMVPRRYRDEDPVTASRRYYYARKRGHSTWSKRPVPWFMQARLDMIELAA